VGRSQSLRGSRDTILNYREITYGVAGTPMIEVKWTSPKKASPPRPGRYASRAPGHTVDRKDRIRDFVLRSERRPAKPGPGDHMELLKDLRIGARRGGLIVARVEIDGDFFGALHASRAGRRSSLCRFRSRASA
jgi:hypothetical protein